MIKLFLSVLKDKVGQSAVPLLLLLALAGTVGAGGYIYFKSHNQTTLPTPTPSPGGLNTSPQNGSSTALSGIFAVLAITSKGGTSSPSFSDSTYTNPNISGVAPRVSWDAIEPQEGQFNWQFLDDIFQKATTNGKKVVIIPVAGFNTPAWALQGVQTADFPRKYGPGTGQVGTLPLPWDQTYLSRWYDFLSQLSSRYANNPAFVMVGVGGPTSVSAEMSLPNNPSDVQQWITLGYTPSKYIDAWKQTFAQYSKLFPNQHLVLALYPGLPINEQGQVDHTQSTLTRQAIIDIGANSYPNQFALQTSGLKASKAVKEGDGYSLVLSYSEKIVTGFQMSTSATIRPAQLGDANNPANALKLSIDKGVQPSQTGQIIKYLEIYEPDINNPDMQTVLAYGQQILLTGTAPQPTISTSSTGTGTKRARRAAVDTSQVDLSDPTISY